MSLETPVCLTIFNRPDCTKAVFDSISKVKPSKLFVIADGPRFPEETKKCEKARAVIEQVDWDCEVLKRYSDKNLGCGLNISQGLSWMFSQVEEAIILEDDTIPSSSFFNFCKILLEKYRYDERIVSITGHNHQPCSRTSDSYYFSKFRHNWGWASWQRAWKHFDFYMKPWSTFKEQGLLSAFCEDAYEQKYWSKIFDNPSVTNTWDYQWLFSTLSQNGLTIVPRSNLISNIGFGHVDAAHTLSVTPWANLPAVDIDIENLKHPQFIIQNKEADVYTFDYICGGNALRANTLPRKIRRRLLSLMKSLRVV